MSRKAWAFDVAVALAVGVLGQLEAWWAVGSTHRQGPLWVQSLLYAVTAALLLFRRVHPLGCLLAMAVISLIEFVAVGSPEGFAVSVAPLIAIYTVGNRLEWRRSWPALVLAVTMGVAWAAFDPMNDSLAQGASALVWIAPGLIAWLLGTLLRVSRLNVEQRRINREQRATQAVAEERTRIARELHDVIGHSVSVMTVQASAVRRRLRPEQLLEREALEAVEATGREALAEMRRMVGVLRRSGLETELEPSPGLSQVDRLIDNFRTAGLPVSVAVTGTSRNLTPGLDLTAYRLVQEGLTNTLRHARNPRHAEVAIEYRADRIELAVRDDGEPAATATTPAEPGNGLLGMRERVALYGGSLVAHARPEGGFELFASLPMEPR